jgi:hypothetical protein
VRSLDACMGTHFMSDWGEPEFISGKLAQRRQCRHCNLVEYRGVSILLPREEGK